MKFRNVLIFCLSISIFSCQKFTDFKTADATSANDGYYVKTSVKPTELTLIEIQPPTVLKTAGDMAIYNKYLFVGEYAQGIHIYKNIDAATNPVQIGYLKVPTLIHFRVENGHIVGNSGNDLVSYRIAGLDSLDYNSGTNGDVIKNIMNFGLVKRVKDQFVYPNYPMQTNIYFQCPDTLGFVTEWEKRSTKTNLNCYR